MVLITLLYLFGLPMLKEVFQSTPAELAGLTVYVRLRLNATINTFPLIRTNKSTVKIPI